MDIMRIIMTHVYADDSIHLLKIEKFFYSHHAAAGAAPLSPAHHPERAVPEALEHLQLRLLDEAGERGARLCRSRAGGLGLGGEGLLGVGLGTFHRKHLQGAEIRGL